MVDYIIDVISIDDYYQYDTEDKIIIIDEYDMIVNESPYFLTEGNLEGLWKLRDKKVIAFSATSSIIFEKFVNNCI